MLTDLPEWRALAAHREAMADTPVRGLFAADPERFGRFSFSADGLLADFSRHRMTDETLALLLALARAQDVEGWRDRMFAGDTINTTENRAVLHTALRRPREDTVMVDGENVMPFVHGTLDQMRAFSDAVRSGAWTGHTGRRMETVVNIGIGGSDLGPRMVCAALAPYAQGGPDVRFVANVDPADLAAALAGCDPETTLFLVASKTFTTQETMENARAAKAWLCAALKDEDAVARHFVALSTNEKAVAAFGIPAESMFPFRDWVGGRYSLWSAIGLPVCMAVGFENFRALLDGAHAMDRHFAERPAARNLPLLMGLLGVWYRNFWGAESYAALPYDHRLGLFPAWLQQLDMESNGKGVDREGAPVPCATGPVVFGQPGTNGQHAFYQLIHQGTAMIPCDFIAARQGATDAADRHRILLANMAAQAQALMRGRTLEEAGGNPHRVFPGSRPSTVLLVPALTPFHLGQILALYEHKVFVQGIIWGVNSFDQWGVELGKELAHAILGGGAATDADSGTRGLLAAIG